MRGCFLVAGEKSNEYQLIKEIINRSVSRQWDEAKQEWQLSEIYREDEPLTCLCGHTPIIEICVLKNKLNDKDAIVGNVCVNKFLGIASEQIFSGLRRIKRDINKGLSRAAATYSHERNWINDWEKGFCLDTSRKRTLSEKQKAIRRKINSCVLSKVTNMLKLDHGRGAIGSD